MRWHFLINRSLWALSRMVSIPFYYVARDVIGFLRSLQPATKLPGADAGREEKVNPPLFEIALVLVRLDHVATAIVNANHKTPLFYFVESPLSVF
jgi:hypothetical protein